MSGSLSSSIEIRNECPKAFRLSLPEVRRTAVSLLKKAGFKKNGLSLLLVGDRRMRTLNRKFLNHDWTTDVITFSYLAGAGHTDTADGRVSFPRRRESSKLILRSSRRMTALLGDLDVPVCAGEIIISLDTAKKLAKELGHSPQYEFYFYLCHGILHLAGYDDDTPRQRAAMLKKQADILKKIGIEKRG